MRTLVAYGLGLLGAMGFLTAFPLGRGAAKDRLLGHAIVSFPLVGAFLGLALIGQDFLLRDHLPRSLHALGLVLAGIVWTRGMHWDGLADTCDAILSHTDNKRALEIMRDSRIGTMGCLALLADFALRWQLLCHASGSLVFVLLIPPMLGRMAMGMGMLVFPYARKEGLANAFLGKARRRDLAMLLMTPMVLVVLVLGGSGLVLWSGTILVGVVLLAWCRRQFGGYTGDLLGAVNEVVEIAVLSSMIGWMP